MLKQMKYKRRYTALGMRKLPLLAAVLIAFSMLLAFGFFYRTFSGYLEKTLSSPVNLDRPLNGVPLNVGSWTGQDVPVSLEILKVAQNDDYLNRFYTNSALRMYANLYIAFSATPRTMLGHRPQVCYKGAGWILDEVVEKELVSSKGKRFSCLVHKFHKDYDEIYVLNYYILNGKITTSESGFTGIALRVPNIDGKIARYVAQVQISSKFPSYVETAAADFFDVVAEFFPKM